MKKQALGKGLQAFLSEEYGILKEERFAELDIEMLRPNPSQPRKRFDQESIDELASSIKESGVLQPIVVVPEEDYYKIIIGERRWRASQKIGLKRVPVIIRTMGKEKQIEASLIENLQREDLNPMEIAAAYKNMMEELSYTQEEVSQRVGKDRASIANYVRLLKLPDSIQHQVAAKQISMGHARALVTLESVDLQVEIASQVVKKSLSVRDVEHLISRLKDKLEAPKKKTKGADADPDLAALQDSLVNSLGTKVAIKGNREKGAIQIFYFSMEDLNRIYDTIKGD
jgi:ParB family transcriptional regulator, chromosome partitioning protein